MKKKAIVIASLASVATVTAWSLPAFAEDGGASGPPSAVSRPAVYKQHDKEPGNRGHGNQTTASVPEPGSMALLALGLGGLGLAPLRRRRKR